MAVEKFLDLKRGGGGGGGRGVDVVEGCISGFLTDRGGKDCRPEGADLDGRDLGFDGKLDKD